MRHTSAGLNPNGSSTAMRMTNMPPTSTKNCITSVQSTASVQPKPGHERHEEVDHQKHLQWEPDDAHVQPQVVLVNPGGHAHVGDRREVRCYHGDAGGPPRRGAGRNEIPLE